MQTFLPDPDFAASAAALDDRRLGKQRVEAMQVLRGLTRPGYGWQHHPAVVCGEGTRRHSGCDALTICAEWCRRSFADTFSATIAQDLVAAGTRVPPRTQQELAAAGLLPPWLGDAAFHRSHRSALLRTDPEHYAGAFGDVPDDLSYVGPGRRGTPDGE